MTPLRNCRVPGLLVCFAALAILAPSPVAAQNTESGTRHIDITSVSPEKSGGAWKLAVEGISSSPDGTRVEFQVTWRAQAVESQVNSVKKGKFSVDLELKKVADLVGEDLQVVTVIELDGQPAPVKKAIEASSDAFPKALAPWTDYHFAHKFRIGTAEEKAARLKAVQEFFLTAKKKLLDVDSAIAREVKALSAQAPAEGKSPEGDDPEPAEDQTPPELDPDKWKEFFLAEVAKLVEMQEAIQKNMKDNGYRPYMIPLHDAQEMANGVARRILRKQEILFRKKELELPEELSSPEGLQVTTRIRRVPNGRYLNEQWRSIAERIGIELKEDQ